MEEQQKKKLFEMAPLIGFIAGYFFCHLFDWQEISQIIGGVFFSVAVYVFLVADLKMEHKKAANYKRLDFYSALLTLLFVILFVHGILYWNLVWTIYYRMALSALLLLIYFFALFRGMRVFMELKQKVENKKK